MAGREKDFIFILTLRDSRLITLKTLVERAALIQETASAGALLPRLQKLLDHLRGHCTGEELQPLLELLARLTSQP